MRIGPCDTAQRIVVVAEIGVNHEGNLDAAKRLIEEAARAGADAAKFQTYRTEQFVMRREAARFEQRRQREFSPAQFAALAQHCETQGILFLSTPLDVESLEALNDLVPVFKIASLDFTNHQLLDVALRTGKPLLLSCGMSDDATIQATLAFITERAGAAFVQDSIALLHCVSSYPAPVDQVNLQSIPYLRRRYGVGVGYSDHTVGIHVPLAAAALGARIIEKHFTLDKATPGMRDHQLSADPSDLRQLIEGVRQIEAALGRDGKQVAAAERENLYRMKRGLVAATDLPEGTRLTQRHVRLVIPCEGLPSDRYFAAIGRVVTRAIKAEEPIGLNDIAWEEPVTGGRRA
jgi:sialic acid synthase SpsE